MSEHDFMSGADELVAKALTRKNDGQAALLEAVKAKIQEEHETEVWP